MIELWLFQIIRLIPLLVVFGVAAWFDFKTGEVPNRLWLYGSVGLVLSFVELFLFTPFMVSYAVFCMFFTFVFSLGLFYVNDWFGCGGFGGADAKALIVLSLSFPLMPVFSVWQFTFFYPWLALVFTVVILGLKLVASKGKLNLKTEVRFIPYLFAGMLLAAI